MVREQEQGQGLVNWFSKIVLVLLKDSRALSSRTTMLLLICSRRHDSSMIVAVSQLQ